MNIKYAAPAATLLLAAIAAILFVLLSNPDADENDPVPAVSPTPELGSPTPVPTFTPLPATQTPVPTVAPTAKPAPTAQPTPTAPAPTATTQPSPTTIPTAVVTAPPFPSSFPEHVSIEPDFFFDDEFPRRGADGVIFDGTHLWMRSHTPVNVLVQLNADGSKTGYEPEYGPGSERYFGGPALYDGAVWMLDVENDTLIRVDGASESMASIPIGPTDEPNVRDVPVLFGTESGLWVRRSTTTATAYDAQGNVLREISWPFESERVVATDKFVFVEDDSNNEILQLSLDGTELQRIPLGFKPYLLYATDDRIYARSNAGGFIIRGPTVFAIDVESRETVEYTTPDRPDSKKAIAILETEDWIWVAYGDIGADEYTGDVVRFSLDGTAQHRYIAPPGLMASTGDYVWVSDFISGFRRIPSPQP